MSFIIEKLIRKNILNLLPYSSARDEFKEKKGIFLDANENALGSVGLNDFYNRYPDNLQKNLKENISKIKGVKTSQIFLGNGSDEAIDLIYRIFCEPHHDNAVLVSPTYGMYEVSANINAVESRKALLTEEFELDIKNIWDKVDAHTKVVFICSPNNPTGNRFDNEEIISVCKKFNQGIVIVDEAYIDFSEKASLIKELDNCPNLIILQTFSKAWGLANLRLGMAFASERIISFFNKVKPPYNISGLTQSLAFEATRNIAVRDAFVQTIIQSRKSLEESLKDFPFIKKIYPSDANFLLIKVEDANHLYNHLTNNAVIVRNRSKELLCENCLRITIGTEEENKLFLEALKKY